MNVERHLSIYAEGVGATETYPGVSVWVDFFEETVLIKDGDHDVTLSLLALDKINEIREKFDEGQDNA